MYIVLNQHKINYASNGVSPTYIKINNKMLAVLRLYRRGYFYYRCGKNWNFKSIFLTILKVQLSVHCVNSDLYIQTEHMIHIIKKRARSIQHCCRTSLARFKVSGEALRLPSPPSTSVHYWFLFFARLTGLATMVSSGAALTITKWLRRHIS